MANAIAAARDKASDLVFELHIRQRDANFWWGCICYRDPVDVPGERHKVFALDADVKNLSTWLGDIRATGGGDGPEDFVGAIMCALERIEWREGSKRALIWMADAPGHGRRYCGIDNHQEEEPKLEPLVQQLAREQFYFVGLSLNGGADRSFKAMKEIYDSNEGKSFIIESFTPNKGSEIDGIAETMSRTTMSTIQSALAETFGS
jgi:hypothetical protein